MGQTIDPFVSPRKSFTSFPGPSQKAKIQTAVADLSSNPYKSAIVKNIKKKYSHRTFPMFSFLNLNVFTQVTKNYAEKNYKRDKELYYFFTFTFILHNWKVHL